MDLSTPLVTSDGLFEKLMSCPLKRKLVINLIASEKNNIEEYKKNLADQKYLENTSDQSPLRKVQKKYVCESPTALLRRRALEQKNPAEIQWSPTKKNLISTLPAVSKILSGVVAFIDVKSKDCDRSGGVKALLHCMGATVEQQFTKEVTHVIFKDGSFSTYQRANLMNVHLVSVLWIEACRNSGVKVAEKKFPALGTEAYDHNISALCSQLQKDYEEIIREEYSRSMITGTPLPSTKALINKRRTITTPNASFSSFIGKNWSQEYIASEDAEVAEINQERRKNYSYPVQSHTPSSPELTEDDSDLVPFIAGEVIQKKIIGLRDRVTGNQSTEEFNSNILMMDPVIPTEELINTDKSQLARKDISSPKTPNGFYNKNTPKINKSGTYNNIYSDESSRTCSDSDGSTCKRRTRSLGNKKDAISFCLTKTVNNTSLTKKKLLLQVPNCTGIEQTKTSSNTNISSERRCNTLDKSSSTNMSNLQLSNNHVQNSSNTNMSVLQISSDTNKNMASFNSNNNSFSPIQPDVIKDVLQLLDTSLQSTDNITRRHKKTFDGKIVSAETRKDDGYSKDDKINFVGSCESDNKGDFINVNLNECSTKPLNQRLKTRKINSPCTGKSKSETPQLSRIGGKNKYKKTDSTGKSICDAIKNSEIHNGSIKILNDKSSADLFDNNNEKIKNCLKLSEDGEIQKTSRPLSIKSSVTDSSAREKSVNRNGRKLYDPSDSSQGYILRNDREWENMRQNSKNSDEFLKPEVTLSTRAKRFVDKHNINVDKVLGNCSERFHDRNQKLIKKKRSTIESVEKHITSDDDHEQNNLKRQILTEKSAEVCNDTNLHIVEDDSVKNINDKKNSVYVEVGTNKENMINTFSSLPKPVKLDEKSAKRRCSRRLTRRSRNISTDTISRTEEKLNQSDSSEQYYNTNQKLLYKITGKSESVGKNIIEDDKEHFELMRQVLDQKCTEKSGDINLVQEIKTKKENLSCTTSPYPKTAKTRLLQSDEKSTKRRCSLRLTQRSKKVHIDNFSRTEKKVHQDISENRRSTREFQTKLNSKKTKIDKRKQPSIVCTKMHKDEIEVFSQIVKKLGGFLIEDEVTRNTTHLVAGEPRRTINMLRAIVTGCWIVNREWLFQSLEAGKWLPEEDFELTEFSPAVQQCRLQRQAFGASYSMDIFHDCGPIFIAKGSTPRCSDLRELVTLCKGKYTNNARNSKLVIGELLQYDGVICVKENWILDSITLNRRMPFKTYIIPSSTATST